MSRGHSLIDRPYYRPRALRPRYHYLHPVRPSLTQRVFASNLPLAATTWIFWIALAAWLIVGLLPLYRPTYDGIPHFAFLACVAVLFAFLVAVFAASIVIPPLYEWRGRLNGAPYAAGDHVRILVPGRRRDRVVRVRHYHPESAQVIVELNDDGDFNDTYGTFQVCRATTDPAAPADGGAV